MEATLTDVYIKGFNNGYFLAKHNLSLIEKLVQTESNLEYIRALKDGSKTYKLEQQKERVNDLRKLRSKGNRDIQR